MTEYTGKNLVFLLSMPRSGSTMLSMMLGNHPQICCPPEPWIILAVAECWGLGNVGSMIYGREWAGIAAIEFLLNAERKKKGAAARVIRAIGEASQMDSADAARHVLKEAYQSHLDVSGKIIFADKTPRYYMVLDLIDNLFPESRKIVLLRNPLDIYSSYKKTWGTSRSIFTTQGVTDHTRDFCEGLFKLADYSEGRKDLMYIVHYEDLIQNSPEVLRRIGRFIGVEFSSAMMSYDQHKELMEEYRRSPVGDRFACERSVPSDIHAVNTWEKSLETEEIQCLVDSLGANIFERLGYAHSLNPLRNMRINIPSEKQALETRYLLMRTLIENVKEQPFSAWDNFVSSLRYDPSGSDHVAALEQKLIATNAELEQMRSSNSWSITKPFRFIRRNLPFDNLWRVIKK